MDIGVLHTHHFVGILYGLYILVVGWALWHKQGKKIEAFRKRTRWLRMILEILLVLTGLYLLFRSPVGFSFPYLLKYTLLILSIFLIVVAFKKHQFHFAFGSFLLFMYIYGISRTHDYLLRTDEKKVEVLRQRSEANGEVLYGVLCYRCHGEKGKGGYLKAPDLQRSPNLHDTSHIKSILQQGKGIMPAFHFLNEKEQKDLIQYLQKNISK